MSTSAIRINPFDAYYMISAITILSDNAKAILVMILFRSRSKGFCHPGQEKLAEWLHKSIDQIQRGVRELRDGGWIRVERRFLQSNRYYPTIENGLCRAKNQGQEAQTPILEARKPLLVNLPNPIRPDNPLLDSPSGHGQDHHGAQLGCSKLNEAITPQANPAQTADSSGHSHRTGAVSVTGLIRDRKEKTLRLKEKRTNASLPKSPEPTPPTSEQRPSVSLEPMIKNFEDIKIWTGHTCLRCGTKDKELHKVRIDNRKPMADLTNLQPLCGTCYEATAKNTKYVIKDIRKESRPGIVKAQSLSWPEEFGQSQVEQAALEFETLTAQLPGQARRWCQAQRDQAALLVPVIRTALNRMDKIRNLVGYLVGGMRTRREEMGMEMI
ncbi:MAG: helix-turn-helix domain-containing protein [Deltaproteobacteria bacterium]|nr:helix-turn-helix domain-containing protein [Deltaproteobacteria bacterium]